MQDPLDATKTPLHVDFLGGAHLGRFRVVSKIGSGGMGQVYRAHDTTLKRTVAIKRMAPQLQQGRLGTDRFLKEAQRASALNHPNIAAIYDVFEENGEVYLVMEFIEGTTLRQYVGTHKLTLPEFLAIAVQCAEALSAAHHQQILHGDIKPENIMLTSTHRVKVLDFGVARRFTSMEGAEATQSLATMTGSLSGTPAYMAPEVLEQKPYDGRADLFSLGLVFYEMLGGPQPFITDSFAGTLGRVLHTDPPPINEINRTVPAPVAAIIKRLLLKDPAERYPSAGVLVADLQTVQHGGSPASVPHAENQEKHRRGILVGATLAIVIFVGLGFFVWSARQHSKAGAGVSSLSSTPVAQNRVLAILPFDVAGMDSSLAALGQGVVDSVATRLGRLGEEKSLQVVSARTLKERGATTLVEAQKQFGANAALSVKLQQANDLITVTYQIQESNGRTLGGESIPLPSGDTFGVEDDVINGTVRALGLKLRSNEQAALQVHGTTQPEAYNYYLRARGYLLNFTSAENVDNAITMVRESLKVDKNFGMAKAALGEAYWRKYWHTKQANWTKLAKSECDGAVKLGNAGVAGHICLGLVNDGTGQYKEAAAEYQRAVELEPTNEDAYIGLALAYEHQGAITKAEQTYQTALEIHPQSAVATNALGNFYLRQNDYAKAVELYRRVTDLAPEGYAGYVNLGVAYIKLHRDQEALEALNKSLVLRPTYAAYVNIGTVYWNRRDYTQASANYEQALKINDKQYVTWGNLGESRYYSGARAEAMPAYRKAAELAAEELKVNPHDTDVLGDLANYYSMMGQKKESLGYLEQALQYGRNDKEVLIVAALVHNQLGDTGLALEWMNKAMQAGYPIRTLEAQPAVQNLARDPRFQELIARQQSSK
jgi:tetratricopeptide (TPR) repeat protein/tRNA A-37 threonylcarbamoyl transferase component Bud32